MKPSQIGERTEIAVMAALVDAGLGVLVPFGGYHRFDLAFEDAGHLVKVQCKSGPEYNGVVVFATSDHTVGVSRDYRGEVDLFGVYCHSRCEVYLVPVHDVPRRGAHLRVKPAKNNQTAGIREAAVPNEVLVRHPDAVVQLLMPAGSTRTRTLGNRPSGITSSLPRAEALYRQMSMLQCTVGSTNVDIGATMPIPVSLAEGQLPVACCSPLAAPKLDDASATATAALFKALGDPHRVRVVNLLLANPEQPICVCDITAYLGLSQSTVSFHLKKLVNAGILNREQRGTWAYYSIDLEAMATLREVVGKGALV